MFAAETWCLRRWYTVKLYKTQGEQKSAYFCFNNSQFSIRSLIVIELTVCFYCCKHVAEMIVLDFLISHVWLWCLGMVLTFLRLECLDGLNLDKHGLYRAGKTAKVTKIPSPDILALEIPEITKFPTLPPKPFLDTNSYCELFLMQELFILSFKHFSFLIETVMDYWHCQVSLNIMSHRKFKLNI